MEILGIYCRVPVNCCAIQLLMSDIRKKQTQPSQTEERCDYVPGTVSPIQSVNKTYTQILYLRYFST